MLPGKKRTSKLSLLFSPLLTTTSPSLVFTCRGTIRFAWLICLRWQLPLWPAVHVVVLPFEICHWLQTCQPGPSVVSQHRLSVQAPCVIHLAHRDAVSAPSQSASIGGTHRHGALRSGGCAVLRAPSRERRDALDASRQPRRALLRLHQRSLAGCIPHVPELRNRHRCPVVRQHRATRSLLLLLTEICLLSPPVTTVLSSMNAASNIRPPAFGASVHSFSAPVVDSSTWSLWTER